MLTKVAMKPDIELLRKCVKEVSGSFISVSKKDFAESYVASSPIFTRQALATLGCQPLKKPRGPRVLLMFLTMDPTVFVGSLCICILIRSMGLAMNWDTPPAIRPFLAFAQKVSPSFFNLS